jgi:Ca2+-binding RTX toxin-like protein
MRQLGPDSRRTVASFDFAVNKVTNGSNTVFTNAVHLSTPLGDIIISHAESTAQCASDGVPPPPPGGAECEDGVDNDGDGQTDMDDPDCSSPDDDSEAGTVAGGGLPRICRKPNAIVGTRGPDRLKGTRGRDIICGLAGKDVIRGRGARDRIFGNKGSDRMFGQRGGDRIRGHGGRDKFKGGAGKEGSTARGAMTDSGATPATTGCSGSGAATR